MQQVIFKDLGLVDYKETWDYQESLNRSAVDLKIAKRKHPGTITKTPLNYLLFCQHPHVFTLGKSGSAENLLATSDDLNEIDASFYKINRGGDITYHGPGQIVGYPILDLESFFTDIHKYLRFLEEIVILTLAEYRIMGERYPGYTGVWIDVDDPLKSRKICAMGVRCSRWVTMHGFALNVNTDLSYFNHIVPCGIDDKKVTSIEAELGKKVDLEDVKEKLKSHFCTLFQVNLVDE